MATKPKLNLVLNGNVTLKSWKNTQRKSLLPDVWTCRLWADFPWTDGEGITAGCIAVDGYDGADKLVETTLNGLILLGFRGHVVVDGKFADADHERQVECRDYWSLEHGTRMRVKRKYDE